MHVSMCCPPPPPGGVGQTWEIWPYPRSNSPWWGRILSSNPPIPPSQHEPRAVAHFKTGCKWSLYYARLQMYVQGKVNKSSSVGPKCQVLEQIPRMSGGGWVGWATRYIHNLYRVPGIANVRKWHTVVPNTLHTTDSISPQLAGRSWRKHTSWSSHTPSWHPERQSIVYTIHNLQCAL